MSGFEGVASGGSDCQSFKTLVVFGVVECVRGLTFEG